MDTSNFNNFEIIDSAKGLAFVQAPEQMVGGREAVDLNQLISNLNKDELKSFVIDLSHINAINSSGLGALISAFRTLQQKEIKLFLLNPSPKIKELMSITHLDKVFTFISDLSEI